MPLYEYQCEACGSRFEVIRKFSDPALLECTSCGKGPVQRLQSSPAIQFKGTGWYITDYAQKEKPSGKSAAGGDEPKGASTPAPPAADTGTGKNEPAASTPKPTKSDT